MQRELADEELRAQHTHMCGACYEPAVRYTGETTDPTKMAKRICYCEDPCDDRPCRDRAPGERNRECPTLDGYGAENITQLMRAEYGYPPVAADAERNRESISMRQR